MAVDDASQRDWPRASQAERQRRRAQASASRPLIMRNIQWRRRGARVTMTFIGSFLVIEAGYGLRSSLSGHFAVLSALLVLVSGAVIALEVL